MTRTQIQFPDPLYKRLKEIAKRQDWSLSEVMRKAAEHFITRFPAEPKPHAVWRFPKLDCCGDFLSDPSSLHPEADAILQRSDS
ncbi:MAG: ribbon-helix-helix protein, CopG family [Verrucomicrobiaceae bacterium]